MVQRRNVALVMLAFVGAWALLFAFSFENEALSQNNGVLEKRIVPEAVNLGNVESFKAQLRRDLPIGTPKVDVEDYLVRWGIQYAFVPANTGQGDNTFYASLKNLGTQSGFPTDLAIRIHLDSNGRVEAIIFRLDHF